MSHADHSWQECPDLYPTQTRLQLLQDVADGEVWRTSNGESVRTDREAFGVSDFVERVTARIAEAERAGWVRCVELRFGSHQWQLTDAGRSVLLAKEER